METRRDIKLPNKEAFDLVHARMTFLHAVWT